MVLFCLAMLGVFSTLNTLCFAQLAPVTEPVSPQFHVDVRGTQLPVYVTRVCNLSAEARKAIRMPLRENTSFASFTSFDLSGQTDCLRRCIGGKSLHASEVTENSFVQNVALAP